MGPIARPVIGATACYVGCVNVFGETLGSVLSVVAMTVMLSLWALGFVGRMAGLIK